MKLETLLPLGKVDPGLREPEVAFDLQTIGSEALKVESLGYDNVMFEETKFIKNELLLIFLIANDASEGIFGFS